MNEAWDVQDSGCVSLWGLWAWRLSFGYALSDALLRIVLWANASPTSWRQETWLVLVLAAAAAIALLLRLRRDRHAALVLSVGAGLYELLDRGLPLYSTFLVSGDPDPLQEVFQLLSAPYWWIHQILWLPLLVGGYLALRRSRRAWVLLCASATGALYLFADLSALWYLELQSSTILAFQVCSITGYASAIVAFLFAYLDAPSPDPVRLEVEKIEPEPNDERSEALKLRKRLRWLLLGGTILLCLNNFFDVDDLLNAILSMMFCYNFNFDWTNIQLLSYILSYILPCAAFLYSLCPFASPKILITYACYEVFGCALWSAAGTFITLTNTSVEGNVLLFITLEYALLTALFLAVLRTACRLDGLSCPARAKESSLAWCAYAVSFLYPLADSAGWVTKQFESSSSDLSLSPIKVLLAALCLFLIPRRDRRSALAASAAAGASLLLSIAYDLHWVISRGKLQSLLLSGTWWAGQFFPAALIVGGYLALRRVRWAPFVLTASAVSALCLLGRYESSLRSSETDMGSLMITIVKCLLPLFACISAWRDRR